jgi:preprotein translocase subunit SecG
MSGVRRSEWRSFSSEPVEIGQPDLDKRSHGGFEARLARDLERLLVALPGLRRVDALLETVVTRHEQTLDLRPRVVAGRHAGRIGVATIDEPMISVFAVLQVLISAALVVLVLLHSGREAGFGGIGFTPASQGGTHIVERNLTRLTVVVAVLFAVNTVVLYRLLA